MNICVSSLHAATTTATSSPALHAATTTATSSPAFDGVNTSPFFGRVLGRLLQTVDFVGDAALCDLTCQVQGSHTHLHCVGDARCRTNIQVHITLYAVPATTSRAEMQPMLLLAAF